LVAADWAASLQMLWLRCGVYSNLAGVWVSMLLVTWLHLRTHHLWRTMKEVGLLSDINAEVLVETDRQRRCISTTLRWHMVCGSHYGCVSCCPHAYLHICMAHSLAGMQGSISLVTDSRSGKAGVLQNRCKLKYAWGRQDMAVCSNPQSYGDCSMLDALQLSFSFL